MNWTREQLDIIRSSGDIKINAIAGSGKTTTVIEYARSRPKESKILYLAFNKSVKLQALNKFRDKGLFNVQVETAHSMAYRAIVSRNGYRVRPQGYKTHEIVELLHLRGDRDKHTKYILGNHINKFIAYFCNSEKAKVLDLNYLDVVHDSKVRKLVKSFYSYIEKQTRLLLAKMDKGEIEITHDFYLKKFQLSTPQLPYDCILFDEGQDASGAMLDIFLKQKGTKVIVGDTHQQIYGWRYAVNSLEKTTFNTSHLSTSFRFGQDIAHLAMGILQWKEHLGTFKPLQITGKGIPTEIKSKATIARTNLGLLLRAIEYVTSEMKVKHIYFEGNINSYTYAEDGASLYDILNLYNGNRGKIRDQLIREMKDLDELEDYVSKTEDMQLGLMVEIVKEYGNEIHDILRQIKDKHVENEEKAKAEMVFSTVHRCKGMEYDEVHIVNDFMTEKKLKNTIEENDHEALQVSRLNEEINLLYVAVTRTRNTLHIPEALLPKGLIPSKQIIVIKEDMEEESRPAFNHKGTFQRKGQNPHDKEAVFPFEQIRKTHKDAYRPWTPELDEELTVMFCEEKSVKEMARYFGRTRGAIYSRIKKLELVETYR